MKGIRKWMVAMFVLMFAIPVLSPILAFAEEGTNVSTVSEISDNAINGVTDSNTAPTTDTTSGDNTGGVDMGDIDGSNYIPDTTIEDANQWVNRKGDDLVGFGGTLAEPVSIIGFIIGLFIALLGAMTKSKHVVTGLLVCIISIFVYVGVVYAPELLHYFSSWLSS